MESFFFLILFIPASELRFTLMLFEDTHVFCLEKPYLILTD